MAVANGIINALRNKLTELGPCKLIAMELSLGKLSGIDQHSLRFALDTVLTDAGYGKVQMSFHEKPAVFNCSECSWQGQLDDFTICCPHCQGHQLEIVTGKDVILERIEVE